jgi:hypothetical protein
MTFFTRSRLVLSLAAVVGPLGVAPAGRGAETLRVGDLAPDFTPSSPDGRSATTLADFRGKTPVVLIFGSCTCPPFRDVHPTLERRYREYGDAVNDSTDRRYAGWPSRIFVVDVDGRIAVEGEPGPRGLVPGARAAEAWLQAHVMKVRPPEKR